MPDVPNGYVVVADDTVASGLSWEAQSGSPDSILDTIIDAKGDLIAGTAADTVARLPVGTDGQILEARASEATGLKWVAAGAGAVLLTTIDAKGDLLVGTAADTIARLPAGTDGQVLESRASEATGLKWVAAGGGGGGIAETLIDAKGDLIVGSADDTAARLAVGSDGQMLEAASGEATGVRWATPAGAGDGCSVYASAVQSISDTTHTAVNFPNELFDSGLHDNVTNNTRITIATAGIYVISWVCGLASAAVAYSLIGAIRLNGAQTTRYAEQQTQSTAGSLARGGGTAIVKLAAADYLELVVWQSGSGGAGSLNTEVNANPQRRPMLQAQYLRSSI